MTTGVFSRMPECDPAAMVICCVKGPAGNEITLALTGRKSCGYVGPSSYLSIFLKRRHLRRGRRVFVGDRSRSSAPRAAASRSATSLSSARGSTRRRRGTAARRARRPPGTAAAPRLPRPARRAARRPSASGTRRSAAQAPRSRGKQARAAGPEGHAPVGGDPTWSAGPTSPAPPRARCGSGVPQGKVTAEAGEAVRLRPFCGDSAAILSSGGRCGRVRAPGWSGESPRTPRGSARSRRRRR